LSPDFAKRAKTFNREILGRRFGGLALPKSAGHIPDHSMQVQPGYSIKKYLGTFLQIR
jgi:hypothetical protein